jgi:PAS domain S-box-containing protein
MKIISFIASFFFFLTPVYAGAIVAEGEGRYDISGNCEVFIDSGGSRTFDEIRSGAVFKKLSMPGMNFGFTGSTVWLRFTVDIAPHSDIHWYIEIGYPLLDRIELFTPDGRGGYAGMVQGDRMPFDKKYMGHVNFLFPAVNSPGRYTYYLKASSTSSMVLPVALLSEKSLITQIIHGRITRGLFYGAFLVMILFNLVLAFTVKDRSYLFYILFIMACLLFGLILDGTGFQYLWPNAPPLNDGAPFAMFFAIVTGMFFFRSFLGLSKKSTMFDRIIMAYIILSAAGAVLSWIVPYRIAIQAGSLAMLFSLPVQMGASISCLDRDQRGARFMIVSLSIMMAGTIVSVLHRFGLLPGNIVTMWAYQVGAIVHIVIISLALTDRINRMKNLLGEMNVNLDFIVKQKMDDLRDSEEKYSTILESGRVGYFEQDLHGNFTFFNEQICAFFGYSKEEMTGMNFRKFISDHDTGRIIEDYSKIFNGGTRDPNIELEIIRKDGGRRYVEISVFLRRDRDGNPSGFRGIGRDVTERRIADEALQEVRERLRYIIDNASECIHINDRQGNILYVNPIGLKKLGLEVDGVLYRNYVNFVCDDYIEKIKNFYRKQLEENLEETYFEYPIKNSAGALVWIGESVKLFRDRHGNIEFHCLARDITVRKLMEEALIRSEEKYRSIIESINEGYFETDLLGNFIFVNNATCSILKYDRGEMAGVNFRKCLNDETAAKVFSFYNKIYRGEISGGMLDHEIIGKDGDVRSLETSVMLIKDESGKPVGFRGVGRDITEKKKTEEALRKSEDQYRQFVEKATDGIFRNDKYGNFLFVNPSGERLLGYGLDELHRMNYRRLIPDDCREEVLGKYREQIEKKIEETYIEFPIIRKDGRKVWLGQRARIETNENGEYEFRGISRDITEYKIADEARREMEEQKSRFFANISHEIRTPLTLMLTPIESVIQGDYKKTPDMGFFESLHKNGLKLLKLINNILDLSKIEAGKMHIRVQEADIIIFMRNYVGSIKSAAESRGISVEFTCDSQSIPNLYLDLEKMDKIALNLLSNALKFTDRGGFIRVRVYDDDVYCFVEFTDDGIGIPADSLEMIFDRFGQADSLSSKRFEGTGIGLSLAREFVDMHGGKILVESRFIEDHPENHGSVFTVCLLKGREHFAAMEGVEFMKGGPAGLSEQKRFTGMREMEDLKIAPEAPEAQTVNAPAGRGHLKRILVVDDNPDMRELISTLLVVNYEVITAENGEDGLSKAAEYVPDLIITDVMMPVVNGYEMTRRIKSDDYLRSTPVLMLTAKADLAYKLEGLEYGADDYLTKPFNSKELLTRVKSLLNNYEYQRLIANRNLEIENDLDIARQILEKLLPDKIPEVSGFSSHVTYIPMDKIGGDFYDYEVRENNIFLFIADVSGHGLQAAFLSLITKMSLEGISERLSPRRVLYILNESICRSAVKSNFVTSFYAVIDIKNGTVRFANAGHPPALVYRKSTGEFFVLNARGIPLGWFRNTVIDDGTFHLVAGDRLVLYTDGLIECCNMNGMVFGEERLREMLSSFSGLSATEFSEMLMLVVREFKGRDSFDDDLTLLVLDML